MKKYIYMGKSVEVKTDTYRNNGTLALLLVYESGDRDVVSVNLGSGMQTDTLCFLDTNNNPEIEDFIKQYNLGVPLGVKGRSGFCEYPLYLIFTKAL